METQFLKFIFSLNTIVLSKMVVKGLAKNTTLEMKGLVFCNPKKLKKRAKKMIKAISKTLKK